MIALESNLHKLRTPAADGRNTRHCRAATFASEGEKGKSGRLESAAIPWKNAPLVTVTAVECPFHLVEPALRLLCIQPGQHFVPGPIRRQRLRLGARAQVEAAQALANPQQQPRGTGTR